MKGMDILAGMQSNDGLALFLVRAMPHITIKEVCAQCRTVL